MKAKEIKIEGQDEDDNKPSIIHIRDNIFGYNIWEIKPRRAIDDLGITIIHIY